MSWAVETFALTKCFPRSRGWLGLLGGRDDPSSPSPPAVDGVDLCVTTGELFCLLGPNGAGKTTLIKMLSTLIEPTRGSARVNGYDLRQELAIKATCGLVTSDERSFYWRLTGRQNLEFFARLQGLDRGEARDRSQVVLERVDLLEAADKRFLIYSTGMRQRLSIARALLNKPRLLTLDEPTKGLDPIASASLQRLIRQELVDGEGITVLLTTHDLHEAEALCDRIAIMHLGRIRAVGTPQELRRSLDLGERTVIQVVDLPETARLDLQRHFGDSQVEFKQEGGEDHQSASTHIELPSPPGKAALEDGEVNTAIDLLRQAGATIQSISRQPVSIERIFAHHIASPVDGPVAAPVHSTDPADKTAGEIPNAVRIPSFWSILPAFLKRDLIQEASYRLAFFLQFFNVVFTVLIFYFISELIGEAASPYLERYGGDYFSYVLIGIAFLGYFSTGLSSFSNNLRHAQTTGTLEAMLATPTRLPAIILASSLWDYLVTTLRVVVYLLVGILFLRVDFSQGNYLAALAVICLTVVVASSLGIIAASFVMVVKRGDPINWGVSTLTGFFGGVYYPAALLPAPFSWIAYLLPITYALDAMRLALLEGAAWGRLLPDLLALCAFAIVLLPLSLLAFRYSVHRAKLEGSLTQY